jgi:hypothetical protein
MPALSLKALVQTPGCESTTRLGRCRFSIMATESLYSNIGFGTCDDRHRTHRYDQVGACAAGEVVARVDVTVRVWLLS